MHDAPFYLSMFAVSAIIAQIPEGITDFKELSATVILGVLFWYTLTRINTAIGQLKESIDKLRETIHEAEIRRENENS